MTKDARAPILDEIIAQLTSLGGDKERTRIFTGAVVVDDSPADLGASYIKVTNEEGFTTPALKVGGLDYSNGDTVMLLYIHGTEAVAFSHSPGSSGGNLKVHDHSTDALGGQNLRQIEEFELEDFTELTIDGAGAVTRTQAYHSIDTNGDAASDNLDTINGGTTGDILIIKAEDSARTVVVRHDQDNIWLSGAANISLDDADDHLALIYDGTYWCDIGWSAGGSGGWPFTTITVDDTDADADYSDLVSAYVEGAKIYELGQGVPFAGTDNAGTTLPADSVVFGHGYDSNLTRAYIGINGVQLAGIITTAFGRHSIFNTLIWGNTAGVGDISGIIASNGSYLHVHNSRIYVGGNGGVASGIEIAGSATVYVWGGSIETSPGAGTDYAIYASAGNSTVTLVGLPRLYNTTAPFGKAGGTNMSITGAFIDQNGIVWYIHGSPGSETPIGFHSIPDQGTTIDAGGSISVSGIMPWIAVDTFGAAATDNLDTITGGQEGDIIMIKAANSARTVVVRHNVGNIWLIGEADISLEDNTDILQLIYDGATWCSVGDGGGAGAAVDDFFHYGW